MYTKNTNKTASYEHGNSIMGRKKKRLVLSIKCQNYTPLVHIEAFEN